MPKSPCTQASRRRGVEEPEFRFAEERRRKEEKKMKIRKCYFMDPDDLVALRALAGSLGISEAGLVRRMVGWCLRTAAGRRALCRRVSR